MLIICPKSPKYTLNSLMAICPENRQIVLKNRDLANYKQKLRRKSQFPFKTRTITEVLNMVDFTQFVW